MGLKEDSIAARLAALQAAEAQAQSDALGGAFDDGVASVPAGAGGFTQADIDAAVAAVKGVDAQALADAQAKAASDLAAVQQSLSDMTAKEQIEEQAVADVKAKIDQVQASFDAIRALFSPAPAPVPVDPAPAA